MPEILTYKDQDFTLEKHKDVTVYIKGISSEQLMNANSILASGLASGDRGSQMSLLYQHHKYLCEAGIMDVVGLTERGQPHKFVSLTPEIIDTLGGFDFLKEVGNKVKKLSQLEDSEKN